MGNSRLDKHNRECREIAETLPGHLRKSWLALAYRADAGTKVVSGLAREDIVRLARRRKDSAVSLAKLKRDMPELERLGLVKVGRHNDGRRQLKNEYHLSFDDGFDTWMASIGPPDMVVEVIDPDDYRRPNGHFDVCSCPECCVLDLSLLNEPTKPRSDLRKRDLEGRDDRTCDSWAQDDDPWASG